MSRGRITAGRYLGGRQFLMLVPALLFLTILFAYPLEDMLMRSVSGPAGLSAEHYRRLIDHPVYLKVFVITFQIALSTTVLTLLVSYPLAYLMVTAPPRMAGLLMVLVLAPFFTSILVRTYSWMVILGAHGILNQLLAVASIGPATLLYNRAGVLIGMVYALIPYMVLTLYSGMRGIDRSLLQAAHSLGAGHWRAFRHVFVPLTLPGVAGGALLVFILALGYFVTPRLMGGTHDQTVAMVIDQQVEIGGDFGFAAALAAILLALTLVAFAVYDRLVGLKTLFESAP